MTKFTDLLKSKPVILDGGMGSLLFDAGLPAGTAPESLNIERPDLISDIHRQYMLAGSDIVQTNTFGGNSHRLKESKCHYTVEEINRAGVQLAFNARSSQFSHCLIAGNIGPTGLMLPPLGHADERMLIDIFSEQCSTLSSAGVDLITIETMSDLREARAALRAVLKTCNIPATVCMTFRKTKRGFFTIFGDPVLQSLQSLLEEGAAGVGVNCTLSTKGMLELAESVRKDISGFFILEPNAGEPKLDSKQGTTRITYPETPDDFFLFARSCISIGVDVIGGCCGSGPKHVQKIAEAKKSRDANRPS